MALDFIAGCIGGCAGVVIGHPLDTVKINLQTQESRNPKYRGTIHCFRSLLAKEGARGLYKGMSSPLVGVAAINAIVFGAYGNTQRNLSNPTALSSHFIAGASSGLLQSFFCSPMELAKSRLQVSNTANQSPFTCLSAIHAQEGLRGVFRGLNMTIARDVPAFASYFITYEILTGSGNAPVSTATMLMAGGIAGIASWVVVYPVDVIKSRMQVDGVQGPTKYLNSLDCLRKSVASEGWTLLYRGLCPTVVRAFPVNAATFAVVTWSMRLLEGGEGLWGRCTDAVYNLKAAEAAPI